MLRQPCPPFSLALVSPRACVTACMQASCQSSMSSRLTTPPCVRAWAFTRATISRRSPRVLLLGARSPTKPANRHQITPSSGTTPLSITLPYKPHQPASFVTPPSFFPKAPTTAQRTRTQSSSSRGTTPAAMAGEKEKQGLVLLDFWVSPFGQRCRIALAEKGIPYEYSEQELLGAKSELLLRSNPVHKKIPVLLHSGRPVCESLIILHYLEEAFPEAAPALLPAAGDAYARAQARFWAAYSDKVYEVGTRLWKLKGDARAQARAEIVQVLKNLDGELGDKAFFGGEAFGFVDVAIVPFVAWLPSYERYGKFRVEEVAPRLAAWGRRCGERESVARSLHPPEKVDEFITLLKKIYGIE